MKYGLKSHTMKAIQRVFENYPQIERVLVYGSRAKGNYRNGSDIDLTIIGADLELSLQLRIENELDDLLLPYTIDLSIHSDIENEDLIEHIESFGKEFYKKSNNLVSS